MQELQAGPWSQQDLDAGATKVIPIPLPLGGAVVLGENVIAYFAEDQGRPICMPIAPTIISVRRRRRCHLVCEGSRCSGRDELCSLECCYLPACPYTRFQPRHICDRSCNSRPIPA